MDLKKEAKDAILIIVGSPTERETASSNKDPLPWGFSFS